MGLAEEMNENPVRKSEFPPLELVGHPTIERIVHITAGAVGSFHPRSGLEATIEQRSGPLKELYGKNNNPQTDTEKINVLEGIMGAGMPRENSPEKLRDLELCYLLMYSEGDGDDLSRFLV